MLLEMKYPGAQGLRWQPQGVGRVNVYVLQPTQVAKGKHHMDQRAPKVVLPVKVTRMMHPASDMEGEQTGATFHKIPATIPAGSNGPHRGS